MSAVVCCTQHLTKVLVVHRGLSGCGFGGSRRRLPLFHGGCGGAVDSHFSHPAVIFDNGNFRDTTPIVDNPHPAAFRFIRTLEKELAAWATKICRSPSTGRRS